MSKYFSFKSVPRSCVSATETNCLHTEFEQLILLFLVKYCSPLPPYKMSLHRRILQTITYFASVFSTPGLHADKTDQGRVIPCEKTFFIGHHKAQTTNLIRVGISRKFIVIVQIQHLRIIFRRTNARLKFLLWVFGFKRAMT